MSDYVFLAQKFEKCSKNQENSESCLIQSARKVLGLLDRDISEAGLKSFQSVDTGLHILPKGEKYVNYEQNYKNLKFVGFKNANISNFK